MVGRAGFEPAANRLCLPLQLSLPFSSLWSGLSLHPPVSGACRTVSTPSRLRRAWLGITILYKGFPEFDRIYLPITRQAALNISTYLEYCSCYEE